MSSKDHLIQPFLFDKAFINGEWVETENPKFEVFNPATSELIGTVTDCTVAQAELALQAAKRAFPSWSSTTAKERADLLMKLFRLQLDNLDSLAALITTEMGKPLWEAKGELRYGASFLEWFAEEGRRVNGEILQSPWKDRQLSYRKEAVGVVAMITPWNFPNAMIIRKMSAALAAGCTVVIKPAEDTPYSALAIAHLVAQAGFPPGVVNVLPASRKNAPEIGKFLCESPDISVISFTGSTEIGKTLLKQSAGTVKRLALELGGHAPFIVFESAYLKSAVQGLMAAKFRNGGQSCICPNRIYVQSSVYVDFVQMLNEEMGKQLVLGNGIEDGVTVGPMINERAIAKVERHVEDAVGKGAKLIRGGKRQVGTLFLEPGLLIDCNDQMILSQEETFGPIIPIFKFETEIEVLVQANNTRRGLAGYFYSQDYVQIERVSRKLETGMVVVNEGVFSTCEAPFGGIKESGMGREGSHFGIEEFLNIKYVCLGGLKL